MTIVVGGIWHETNTFSPLVTDRECFDRYQLIEGAAIRDTFAGTNSELGGMLDAAAELGVPLVPSIFGGALPSGIVTREMLALLVNRICTVVRETPDVTGVLLALHGAMVAEGVAQADAYVLSQVRRVLGPRRPLVCTLDSHANLTASAVAAADVLVGYDTLPHVDMAERGAEAVRLLVRLLDGEPPPHAAFRKLPLLSTPERQATTENPMQAVMAHCHRLERAPGIWTASVMLGFPYADVPHLGMATLAYADDPAQAEATADALAHDLWRQRHQFTPDLSPPGAAVQRARMTRGGPVMLIESADNVGGGAPGDGTILLNALLEAQPGSASIVIWDPVAAAAAAETGIGRRFRRQVGGNTLSLHGPPVWLDGRVEFCDALRYQRDRDYFRGQTIDLGLVARITVGDVHVILTSERLMPFDTLHLRRVGLSPPALDIIVMKSASNWSVAFGDIAAEAIYVDTPGVCSANLAHLPYEHFKGRCFPLDPDSVWPGP